MKTLRQLVKQLFKAYKPELKKLEKSRAALASLSSGITSGYRTAEQNEIIKNHQEEVQNNPHRFRGRFDIHIR